MMFGNINNYNINLTYDAKIVIITYYINKYLTNIILLCNINELFLKTIIKKILTGSLGVEVKC